jgi:hypothetical protein
VGLFEHADGLIYIRLSLAKDRLELQARDGYRWPPIAPATIEIPLLHVPTRNRAERRRGQELEWLLKGKKMISRQSAHLLGAMHGRRRKSHAREAVSRVRTWAVC